MDTYDVGLIGIVFDCIELFIENKESVIDIRDKANKLASDDGY